MSKTIAIFSPGEMGGAFGRSLSEAGHTVLTSLAGRSNETRTRAADFGFQDAGSTENAVARADIVLSILPPESAVEQAGLVAKAMTSVGKTPIYVDCNAIAPETVKTISVYMDRAGAHLVDGSILGNPPGKGKAPARLFLSGGHSADLDWLGTKSISVRVCGRDIGTASAIKMMYSGITKGTSALHALMLLSAERLGVSDELRIELQGSQSEAYERMERMTSALPAVSVRYAGEMREIARTLAGCDMPAAFHQGAADLFGILALSPFASESRDTMDKTRSLEQTIKACAQFGMKDLET